MPTEAFERGDERVRPNYHGAPYFDGGCLVSHLRAGVLGSFLAVLAPLLVPAPAAAQPTWVPPEVLGVDTQSVVMDVGSTGDAVAAWSASGVLKTSFRPAGRDWTRPVKVARVGEAGGSSQPLSAFVDPRGRAFVLAWVGAAEDAIVAIRNLKGTWRIDDQAPSVNDACCWPSMPTADMDEHGNLVMSWSEVDDLSGEHLSIAWRRPDGRWSRTRGGGAGLDLVARDGTVTLTRSGNGNALDDGLYVQTAQLGEREASAWNNLRPGAHIGRQPLIEGNGRGDLVVVGIEGENDPGRVLTNAGPGRLVVMSKPAGGAWTDATPGAPTKQVGHPTVVLRPDGEIVITYRRSSDGGVEVVAGQVGATTLAAPVELAASSAPAQATTAVTRTGAVMAAWSTSRGEAVRVAKRSAKGAWTSLGRRRGDTVGGHLVRAYPNGMFTAVHLDRGDAWWSDYVDDDRGPRATMRAPRTASTATRFIPVRWRLVDALSRPDNADVRVRSARPGDRLGRWTIWQRQIDAERLTFPGRLGRRYCFSVRGTDRVGNVGPWSDRRCTTTPGG